MPFATHMLTCTRPRTLCSTRPSPAAGFSDAVIRVYDMAALAAQRLAATQRLTEAAGVAEGGSADARPKRRRLGGELVGAGGEEEVVDVQDMQVGAGIRGG